MNSEGIEEALSLEIATVRKGKDLTASDLANRLMPFIRDVQEDALAPVKRILEMTDEEVGDYNEWGSAQREFLLTELLFPHRED